MAAEPANNPKDDSFTPAVPSPKRTATVSTDDLGITVKAYLRITGVVSEVRDLFDTTPPEMQADVLEKAIVIGATNLATVAEISAVDAGRIKLEQSADRLLAAHDQILGRQEARDKSVVERIDTALNALRIQMADSTKQEAELREQVKDGHEEVVKAAKQLDVTRAEMEKRTTESIAKLVEAQTKAKDHVVTGTEKALRKLMDKADPTSAPALITGVMDKAAAAMRETTNKNIDGLVKDLTKQFGESSPLVEKIAKTVRDGAEAEVKRVEELVVKLREDLLERRTREKHDSNLRGEDYEEDLLELFAGGAAVYGWTVDRTGAEIGAAAGVKKGDHLIIDDTNQKVAAIEARRRKGVSARELYEGAIKTAENRGVRIFLYCACSVDDLPSGLGKSRGLMPFSYKQVADGIHVLTTVLDPTSPAVVERLAVLLFLVDRIHRQRPERRSQQDAVERIAQALPWVQQLSDRLRSFRSIKSGLTKTAGELRRVVDTVSDVEAKLTSDLNILERVLCGQEDEAVAPDVA